MKRLFLTLAALLMAACSPRIVPVIEYRDSIRVEVHERVVHDTVTFEVPTIIEKNVTRDTTSHLENAWARSDASLKDGFLEHSLETKGHTVYIPIEVPVHDTTYIEKESQIQYIEKELTERQQRQIRRGKWAGWALILLAVAGVAAVVIKITNFNPLDWAKKLIQK